MTKIELITVPTKGSGDLFQIKTNGFVVDPVKPQPVVFYWEVYSSEEVEGVLSPKDCVIFGNLTMDVDTYNQWADDDHFCIQWACTQLGFTIVQENA